MSLVERRRSRTPLVVPGPWYRPSLGSTSARPTSVRGLGNDRPYAMNSTPA